MSPVAHIRVPAGTHFPISSGKSEIRPSFLNLSRKKDGLGYPVDGLRSKARITGRNQELERKKMASNDKIGTREAVAATITFCHETLDLASAAYGRNRPNCNLDSSCHKLCHCNLGFLVILAS